MSKLSALATLATLANGDLFLVLDVSDLSMGATGTNKSMSYTDLLTNLSTGLSGTFEVPLTFSTGLTRTINTVTVNTTQNITKLSNLTSNGFVKTSGGDGTLSIDTNTYLTSTSISDTAYGVGWNGDTTTAPSKNAVYDKLELMVSDATYGVGWNGETTSAPSKNAVYDEMENRAPKGAVTSSGLTMATARLLGRSTAGTGAIEELSSADTFVSDANDTTKGKVELAIASEVNTGTDNARAVTPDGLAGSNFGIRYYPVALNGSTALTTSDKFYFRIPAGLTGMNLVSVTGTVGTGASGSSSSGTPTFTVKNVTDNNQMLSTSLTIDANEYTSATAVTAVVIDTTKDDVVTDDLIEVACTVAGTGTTYTVITLGFQLP